MRTVFSFLKSFFARFLRHSHQKAIPSEKVGRIHGTTGRIDAPTLWLHEERHIVLLVDYDFEDFPSWVEWDRGLRKLSIIQMGGAAAELPLDVPANENMPVDDIHRLLLVTGRHERRNAHFVSFIIRD